MYYFSASLNTFVNMPIRDNAIRTVKYKAIRKSIGAISSLLNLRDNHHRMPARKGSTHSLFSLTFLIVFCLTALCTFNAEAFADYYVRAGASGSGNGSDWNNAYTSMPSSLVRGARYWVADGSYGSQTFDDPASGSAYIEIKKATVSDHGTSTGWSDTYGDGQAVFGSSVNFYSSYYIFDGNGDHSIPSKNSNDYGFKVNSNSSTNTSGIIKFGTSSSTVSNITFKYTHVYNATNGSINNGTVCLRFYPSGGQNHIKVQNCYLQNSGKDGIQISTASYILVERCYIERLGKLSAGSPDYHGQTVQIFYGGDDIIFRWNVWEANEGQGLIQIAGIGSTSNRIRFYGNVVFVDYGKSPSTPGFNTSGGIIGNAWDYNTVSYIIHYNNTVVNIGGDYGGVSRFPLNKNGGNSYGYNNLFYNCESLNNHGWTGFGYNASGGGEQSGGSNEQSGITNSIFQNYTNNDFRLTTGTAAGLALNTQNWWDASSDSFFDTVDSLEDMYGNIRGEDGNWDRGAFEYVSGQPVPPPATVSAPDSLRVISITNPLVSASSDDGNGPENTVDGDLGTRWSAEGDGQWIEYDVGSPTDLSYIMIAFYQGDQRSATFNIEVSNDESSWTEILQGVSSGNTLQQERFDFPSGVNARYLRIIGHGNTDNLWNSISEVDLY